MNKLKILVVDDESRMRKLVKDFLVKQNYEVLEAEDGSQAVDLFFEQQDIALIILDVMMPKMDGWQVCREIRNYSKVPIIMLTARTDERDELQGFQLGVDEYIAKPFSPKILVARVEAILRRTNQLTESEVLEYGGISIDKAAHVVTIDGASIDLSFKEFELLTYFMENKGIPKEAAVSVIIPVYNVAAWLDECLRSVVGQTFTDFEAILVDDGSTDGSSELCDE